MWFRQTIWTVAHALLGGLVAFNPDTCESKYLVRDLTSQEADAIQRRPSATEVTAKEIDLPHSTRVKDGDEPKLAASKVGWTQSWYEDPPNWDVTYTWVRTSWTYNGSCVTGAWGAQEHRHMTQSGWQQTGYDWDNVYSCAKSSSNMYASYKNDPFCAGSGNTTYNTYNRTRAEGKGDGSTYWAWPAVKSGGCSSLLSHEYAYGN